MSDNLTISTAGGEETIGADEISSVKYTRNKLIYGADGSNTGDVQLASATAGGLPVQANLCSDFIMVAGLGIAPKFAVINLTATGTLVAAVTSKKIRVLSCLMTIDVLTGDETYTFNSGASGTALTGTIGDASGAASLLVVNYPFSPVGHFETVSGSLLELALGATAEANGSLVYIEV